MSHIYIVKSNRRNRMNGQQRIIWMVTDRVKVVERGNLYLRCFCLHLLLGERLSVLVCIVYSGREHFEWNAKNSVIFILCVGTEDPTPATLRHDAMTPQRAGLSRSDEKELGGSATVVFLVYCGNQWEWLGIKVMYSTFYIIKQRKLGQISWIRMVTIKMIK